MKSLLAKTAVISALLSKMRAALYPPSAVKSPLTTHSERNGAPASARAFRYPFKRSEVTLVVLGPAIHPIDLCLCSSRCRVAR